MKRDEWVKEVASDCSFAEVVSGGAMCHEGLRRDYCAFSRCPKIELEKKEEDYHILKLDIGSKSHKTRVKKGCSMMDINAKKGTKVKFIAINPVQWGVDVRNAESLEFGKTYTVERTEIHSWHTKVFLQEVPGIEFSSAWFEQTGV